MLTLDHIHSCHPVVAFVQVLQENHIEARSNLVCLEGAVSLLALCHQTTHNQQQVHWKPYILAVMNCHMERRDLPQPAGQTHIPESSHEPPFKHWFWGKWQLKHGGQAGQSCWYSVTTPLRGSDLDFKAIVGGSWFQRDSVAFIQSLIPKGIMGETTLRIIGVSIL
jgi:hypothetical protein